MKQALIEKVQKIFMGKRGVYKSWIMSYFSLIIVFFVIFNGVALLSKNLLQDKIMQANNSIFGLISSDLENAKNELDKMSMQIMLDPDVADVLKETRLDNNYYLKINKVRSNMQKLMASFGYAQKFVLFKHNTDMLFVDGGLFDAKRHFTSYSVKGHTDIKSGYDEWKTFMSQRHNQELYTLEKGDIVYVHSIHVQNEILGTAMIVVNQDSIENILGSLKNDLDVNVLLVNHLDEPVFALRDDDVKLLTEKKEISLTSGEHYVKVNKDNAVMFVSEKKSNIKCIFAVPSTVFYSSTNLFTVVVYILTAVFIAIGCIFAFYHSRKNYQPVKNIMGLLEKHQYESSETDDEFTFINETLSDMISKGVEDKITRAKYNKSRFASEFVKFLTDNVYSGSIDEVFDFYNIPFSYKRYIAAVVSVENVDENIWGEDIINIEKNEVELIEIVFSNICGELLGEDYSILTVALNNMYFCLIGTDITDAEKMKKDIKDGFALTKTMSKEKIGIDYSVYASEIFKELSSLKKMYNQVNAVYMFSRLIDESILFYDEIKYEEKQIDETLLEERMLNAVQKGDLKTIKSLIVQMIVQKDAVESSLQLAWVKYNILNVLSKSIKYASSLNDGILLLIDKVNKSSSLIEFLSPLLEFVESLCEIKEESSEKSSTDVVDRLIEYVNLNFSDSDMNVDKLGAEFSLSPSYLSNLFKIKTGEMLRDYIAKVRLQNARKMLLSDMKVEDAAIKSGFVSSKSFIRVFKRYFGITPSQFKKEGQNHQ